MGETPIDMLIGLRSSFLPFLLVLAVLGWDSGHCRAPPYLDSHGSMPTSFKSPSLCHSNCLVWESGHCGARRLLCTFSTYLRSLGQQSSWCTLIPVSPTLLLFFGSLITFSVLGWDSGHCGAPPSLDSNGFISTQSSFSYYRRLVVKESGHCGAPPFRVSSSILTLLSWHLSFETLAHWCAPMLFVCPWLGSRPLRSGPLLGLTGYHLS